MARRGDAWSDQKRVEVATAHVMGLKAPMIEVATGVPAQTVRHWRMQDWFKEIVDEIQREEDHEVDAKLTKLMNKALDNVMDRLDNGEFFWNPKAKEWQRRPVNMRDAAKVMEGSFDKRNLLRGKPTTISGKQEQISDRLLKLAAEFARFAVAKEVKGELINASEDHQEGQLLSSSDSERSAREGNDQGESGITSTLA